MEDIKQIIADNIISIRKENNLTQNEFAKMLNYSDNTVSRWERAEITPSIETLQKISEIFNIPIENLLKEKANQCMQNKNKGRVLVNEISTALLCISSIWFIATIIFVYINMFVGTYYWMIFVWAVPASCLMLLCFIKYWKNKIFRFVVLSVLLWSTIACFYLQFIKYNLYLLFLNGIPLQFALSFWAFMRK